MNYILIAIILFSLYYVFTQKENFEEDVQLQKINTYVAERAVQFLKQNPRTSFDTFQQLLKENNNLHKSLQSEELFNQMKAQGQDLTVEYVLQFL